MENLNAEAIKSELKGLAKFRTCPEYIKDALSLITSQEQKIKELTENLEKCYTEQAKLTEENAYLKHIELEAMRGKAESYKELCSKYLEENERLMREKTALECVVQTARNQAKADTVREMQERLEKEAYPFPCAIGVEYAVPYCKIDQIAKEMLN